MSGNWVRVLSALFSLFVTACGQPLPTSGAGEAADTLAAPFSDSHLFAGDRRPPKGDGSDVPLGEIDLGASGTGDSQGRASHGSDFGYSPLSWFRQLADWVFANRPDLSSVGRITLGSGYGFAFENQSFIYPYWPAQDYCTEWDLQLYTAPSAQLVPGPVSRGSFERLGAHHLRLRGTTYGTFEEIEAYVAVRPSGGTPSFWVMGTARSCRTGETRTVSWQNLSGDLATVGRMTYRTLDFGGQARVATIRFLNRGVTNNGVCQPERILIAGIYESRSDHSAGHHPTGDVTVNVYSGGQVALVLSSYEPTRWTVTASNGTRICRIIAQGYHRQQVIGSAPVELYSYDGGNPLNVGYPYESGQASALIQYARSRLGQLPVTFQGGYRRNDFSL